MLARRGAGSGRSAGWLDCSTGMAWATSCGVSRQAAACPGPRLLVTVFPIILLFHVTQIEAGDHRGAGRGAARGAGHFSFMDVPPPQTTEPLPDRAAFLAELAGELGDFVTR